MRDRLHEATPKVVLRRQLIMGTTAQAQVGQRGRTTASVWLLVMKLDRGHGAAAHAALVDESTATTVTLPDLSPNSSWDVSRV